ncbi:MAG: hypothetical protein ACTSVG_14735 [Alphaproteobacteria bacterium]
MDETNRKAGAGKPGKHRLDKDGRLAEALRENLRKRKTQLRARAGRDGEKTGNRPENDTDISETR